MSIRLKRAYDKPAQNDGYRVLVDRIWPHGVSKDDLKLNRWLKEIAPTTRLRKWFAHDPAKWDEFKRRYGEELERRADEIAALRQHAEDGRLTLVYAAKDREHNNAAALKEYLQRD